MNKEKQPNHEKVNIVYIHNGKPVKVSKNSFFNKKIRANASVEVEINDNS